jgi:hypothetical protein
MAVTPAPVVATTVPVHLLGLQLRGLLAGGDGGMSIRIAVRHAGGTADRLRRQRRGLRGGGERGGPRGGTESMTFSSQASVA